jgi:hypothetical protein
MQPKEHSVTQHTPTADEVAGMYWWNSMSERERSAVMQLAKANSVAEAWDWHKLTVEAGKGIEMKAIYGRNNGVTQDEKSWTAGYSAGCSGRPADVPPDADRLSWISSLIEGKADRDAGRVRPLSRNPPSC